MNKKQSEVDIRYDEPMKDHTTFKVGGPADCYVCPSDKIFASFCADLLNRAKKAEIPVFILGGGANIVVSDNGIRGIVLDSGGWKGEMAGDPLQITTKLPAHEEELILKSGTTLDGAANIAAGKGLSGLEFLAGMPGTIGGAVWMNARCYGKEMADVLKWVEVIVREQITEKNEYVVKKLDIINRRIPDSQLPVSDFRLPAPDSFDYKQSPFQKMDCLILSAAFRLEKGSKEKISAEMEKNIKDRRDKGHYLFPCAGSVFKNNRDFGKPAGQIIDELGLKGYQIGGARIAPFHGNFIINTGNASSADIRALVNHITAKVNASLGFMPEPEIIFVGDDNPENAQSLKKKLKQFIILP